MLCAFVSGSAATTNPAAVVDLVKRVCGDAAADKFVFTLNDVWNGYDAATGDGEAFQLGGSAGAVTITANTLSALTCGLNWYLNHDAKVNICWNNLTETPTVYPAPSDTQVHATTAKYRYYLNYCTFSYSMSTWDEDRWMKEIDWMALHGVNLPLQIVGIDAVWYKVMTDPTTAAVGRSAGLGWTHSDANEFIAGPNHQGWFLMNNLTKFGGPNPEWWYEREADLGKKICQRMLALGMSPCLPGFVGMAPQKYINDNGVASYNGSWCNFASPPIINISTFAAETKFRELAAMYYSKMQEVFGFTPTAFSLDPFHERSNPAGTEGYQKVCDVAREEMNKVSNGALWVAQEWETNADQARINALPQANTLLLDLASERTSYCGRFKGRDYVFCMLLNYGGNVGMHLGVNKMLSNYTSHKNGSGSGTNGVLKGIGATPEGIETNPAMYDLLFELPWLANVPTATDWLHTYIQNRYGLTDNADITNANAVWDNLLNTSAYSTTSEGQQGCFEPVVCILPSKFFSGNEKVSAWSNASAPTDASKASMLTAAQKLLAVNADNDNYIYDLVDIVRQVLAEKAHTLLVSLRTMKNNGQTETADFKRKRAQFMKIIDDTDELLSCVPNFTLHQWVTRARNIAIKAGHPSDADWLEKNARTLITVWGGEQQCNGGQLRDYGNREWAGLLKDYYKARWTYYFANGMPSNYDWYNKIECPFTQGTAYPNGESAPLGKYSTAATQSAQQVRKRVKEMLK